MTFAAKVQRLADGPLNLCVGLDPVLEKMPDRFRSEKEPLFIFCREIVQATAVFTKAFKPNLAFFEAFGSSGWIQLEKLFAAFPSDKLIIADAKRGDIGNTAEAYAKALFQMLGADAATVSPYLGSDSIEPFVKDDRHGAFILALTSNASGRELQALTSSGKAVSRHVVEMASKLNTHSNVGLVLGATRPTELSELLNDAGSMPLLIPGVGAQGGDVEELKTLLAGRGNIAFVNASRSIIYASKGSDFAEAAMNSAQQLQEQLRLQEV